MFIFHFRVLGAKACDTTAPRVVSKNADPPGGPPTAAAARPASSSSLVSHRAAHSREFARVNHPFTPISKPPPQPIFSSEKLSDK